MPTLIRQPQRQPTGIRLIDDLIGADAAEAPPTERQATTLRAPTTYEQYIQPAILALRKVARPVVQSMQDDPLGGLAPMPLASVVSKGAQSGVTSALSGLRRMVSGEAAEVGEASVARALRENRNAAALARYREQFDPMRMEAIEKFHERNPRLASILEFDPKAPPDHGLFTPYEQGTRVGKIQLRDPLPTDTVETMARTLDHEAAHGAQRRLLGHEGFQARLAAEEGTPYLQRGLEDAAQRAARKRMDQRANDELMRLTESLASSVKLGGR